MIPDKVPVSVRGDPVAARIDYLERACLCVELDTPRRRRIAAVGFI
jgi:hypothetical protein